MITKLAHAAVITLALVGSAAASESGVATTTLRFDAAAADTEEGRAAMLADIKRVAREACADTGTRVRNQDCEDNFALTAIASIERPALQAQLKQDYLGAAAPGVAVAQAPGG